MKISLIDKKNGHLTATEKSHIKTIINKGMVSGSNRVNKNYVIEKGWTQQNAWHYVVKIGTYATHTIGANPKWEYRTVIIKTDKPLNQAA